MKANPKPWLYGPNWQGIRCEVRTVGGPCASGLPDSLWGAVDSMEGPPPVQGPRTALGDSQRLKSSMVALLKRSAEAKRRAEQGRQMRGELKELEAWFVDHGHLSKNWRDWF